MSPKQLKRTEASFLGTFYVDGLTGDEFDLHDIYSDQVVTTGDGSDFNGTAKLRTSDWRHVTGPLDDGRYQITGTDIFLVKMGKKP